MDKILNQEEIDALLRSTRKAAPKPGGRERSSQRAAAPFVFGQTGGASPQQIGAITLLHDTFARNLTQRLSAYLRVVLEVNLVSVEQLPYSEFLQRIAERSYLTSINLQPTEATALSELDLAMSFPIIDLLLGGEGKGEPPNRDLTEIEDQIMQSVVKIIYQELQMVWENLVSVKFAFDQKQQQTQVVRLLPSNERILAISFEVRMPDVHGTMTFCFPAAVASALLRKISEQSLTRKRRVASDYIAQRQRRLEDCSFHLEMKLPEMLVPSEDLLRLEVGQTLILPHRVDQPVVVNVADQKMFTAYPVRAANARGGLIQKQLAVAPQPVKEIS
jgi:flagellar motor switch protein FliM